MTYRNYLKIVLKIIAVITVLSGLVQMIKPAFVLGIIAADINPTTNHFFGIVGLFMILFGGLLFHALSDDKSRPTAVFWCGLQKFGASAAVALGVFRAVFGWLALGVAAFDFISGILIMIYWTSIKK